MRATDKVPDVTALRATGLAMLEVDRGARWPSLGCPGCGAIYWKGSHQMERLIEGLTAAVERRPTRG